MKKDSNKTYILGMFPYPSGEGLHVGHVRIYTAVDVMARYFRMKGQEVLHPMGWDAFGLPAENAAIKTKKNPKDMVPVNEANFKRQMEDLSLDFDWERAFSTTDPEYYAITQWIFLQLYNKKDEQGRRLVYREKVAINWCPKCKTGLANEEVLADGTHERCGNQVEKKMLPQWVMRITSYADRLLEDLDAKLPEFDGKSLDWPRGIIEMQRNWIGKKAGVVLHHQVKDMDLQLDAFSAYPAWLWADTFMVIAPDHPLVEKLVSRTEYEQNVENFVQECAGLTDQQKLEDKFEKKGVFTGRYVLDPFNNNREMPVWVANFAVMGFGTGIIRCSAHDPRDYEFAKKYNLELKEVVKRTESEMPVHAHGNEGILEDSGSFTGKAISKEVIVEIVEWIVKEEIGRREVTWHLRDWVFSRQRYWGEPIPLVYCSSCAEKSPSDYEIVEVPVRSPPGRDFVPGDNMERTQLAKESPKQEMIRDDLPAVDSVADESNDVVKYAIVPVPESELPLELPKLESYEPTDTGESPLSRVENWVNTKCPKCGGEARRETDTMPNWAGSCWYFLAYPFWAAKAKGEEIKNLSDAKKHIEEWMPVDWYLGGAEHAVLHLLYARFWVKVLQDLGIVDFPEPFLRLRSVGMVLAEDGKKMSKSIGNVINPDDMVKEFGSDEVRLYEMFMGPWDQSIAWDTRALVGQRRFLKRIEDTFGDEKNTGDSTSPALIRELYGLLHRVERGILEQKFNTSIASAMEFVNVLRGENVVISREHGLMFAQIMSPFAPIAAQKLWKSFDGEGEVHESDWPCLNIELSDEVEVSIVVQVNGKVRAMVEVSKNESENEEKVIEIAMGNDRVKKWIEKEPKKTIFVKGKLVNFVV